MLPNNPSIPTRIICHLLSTLLSHQGVELCGSYGRYILRAFKLARRLTLHVCIVPVPAKLTCFTLRSENSEVRVGCSPPLFVLISSKLCHFDYRIFTSFLDNYRDLLKRCKELGHSWWHRSLQGFCMRSGFLFLVPSFRILYKETLPHLSMLFVACFQILYCKNDDHKLPIKLVWVIWFDQEYMIATTLPWEFSEILDFYRCQLIWERKEQQERRQVDQSFLH